MKKQYVVRLLIALLLIVLGAGGRLVLQDVPNIETIMLVTILAGALLGGRWGIVVGLGTVALSDAFIGNSNIMWFTWSAWAVIGFLSLLLRRSKKTSWSFVPKMTGMGIVGAFFFYLWTNFGVWFMASWYPPTIEGLYTCYLMGLPFLRMHLVSCLTIVPIGAAGFVLSARWLSSWLAEREFDIVPKMDRNHL